MFHFHNGGCSAFMFSSFPMTLFLLPTKRRNKTRVRKGKFFDECVGSVSSDALADVSTDASVGSDSLPLPNKMSQTQQF